ncbi:MAG: hypothetical protein AB7U95_17710 [Reyranella sp.]
MSAYTHLHASQEKIKRAQSKLTYITSAINAYLQSSPVSIRIEKHPDGAYVIACVDKLPPDDLAWEVTEAVGHLRDSLDKLLVDLVELNGRGVSGVGFPFGGLDRNTGKPLPFPSARHDHIKQKLTAEQWTLIEAQKPYPGGNDTLWAVNEIANADKHRKGLVTVRPKLSGSLGIGSGYGMSLTRKPEHNSVLKDKEREQVLVVVSGHGQQHIHPNAAPIVIFGDIMPVQGKDILVTLTQQVALIESIIEIFGGAFF